jgi:hypothetical protein
MRSNVPAGHCSGTNICSKRTVFSLAHLRLAAFKGAAAESTARIESQREASSWVRTPIEQPISNAWE